MDKHNVSQASKTQAKSHNALKLMVLTALLFAIALVLSMIEGMLPPIMLSVPGVKLGLSNIAVMYALFFLGKREAYTIAILKAVFVLLVRSPISALLSLSGGILSVTVMIVLMAIFKEKISYLILSVFGAVFHNIGQLFAVSLVYTSIYIWSYMPVLLITGIATGTATSILLKFILPAFKKLGLK